MIRVLFVCHSNICRSPLAEGLFRLKVMRAGLDEQIESRAVGISDAHLGELPHPKVQEILNRMGVNYQKAASNLSVDDFYLYDFILVMDKSNLHAIRQMRPSDANCLIALLLDFAPYLETREIADPSFTGDFEQTYHLLDEGTSEFLKALLSQYDLQMSL